MENFIFVQWLWRGREFNTPINLPVDLYTHRKWVRNYIPAGNIRPLTQNKRQMNFRKDIL